MSYRCSTILFCSSGNGNGLVFSFLILVIFCQVVLHESAEGLELLHAYMQASNLARQRGELFTHQRKGEEFHEFVAALRDKNWHVDSDIDLDDREWRCHWPDSK